MVCRDKTGTEKHDQIILYYRNFMSRSYKVDERVIRGLVSEYVRCTNPDSKINLRIYYQNRKTKSLVMKNNILSTGDKLKRANVVYQFHCPHEDCRLHSASYIGATTTTLSRRITMHLREGSPKEHTRLQHNTQLTREELVKNTTIIASCNDPKRLRIIEALHIRDKAPTINSR